jgi:phospholipid/cholesterol/gamma-HCH transport system permease protein
MRIGSGSLALVERSGDFILRSLREGAFILRFAYAALAAVLTPSIYRVATREVTMRQVYFTAWRVLPWYTVLAALASLVMVEIVLGFATRHGLSALALEMILQILPLEIVPFFTALYVALRSGSAINTEIALMHIHGHLDAIEAAGGSAMRDEFIPRILACAFSLVALTAVSSVIAVYTAYAVLYGWTDNGLAEFTNAVGHVYSLPAVAGLFLKCTLFGVAVAMVPIASGISIAREPRLAAVAVLRGMVRLFFTLALIQIFFLAVTYA